MEMSDQLHAPTALPQGRENPVTIGWEVSGLQSRSGRGGEEKNSQPLPGLEPPIIQLVAQRYTTELAEWMFAFCGLCSMELIRSLLIFIAGGHIY
jgi:hypothetical protein